MAREEQQAHESTEEETSISHKPINLIGTASGWEWLEDVRGQ